MTMKSVVCLISVTAGVTVAFAEIEAQESRATAAPKADVSDEQVNRWVAALTNRDFKIRREASRRLLMSGQAAVGAVVKAADGKDLEQTTRCIYVLRKMQQSDNKKLQAAAISGLKSLARSKNASVARRAAAALPQADPEAQARVTTPLGFRILGRAAARGGKQISVQVVNGQRTIRVVEGKKTIVIEDNQGKNISVKVTEPVDGKPKTREVKAGTAEALKKSDPEAYKLYQQFAGQRAGIQVQIQRAVPVPLPPGVQPAIPLQPALPRGFPAIPLPKFSPWSQQVASAQKSVDAAVEKLTKLASQPEAKPEQLREVLKELASAQKTLAILMGQRPQNRAPRGGKPPGIRRPKAAPEPKKKPALIKT